VALFAGDSVQTDEDAVVNITYGRSSMLAMPGRSGEIPVRPGDFSFELFDETSASLLNLRGIFSRHPLTNNMQSGHSFRCSSLQDVPVQQRIEPPRSPLQHGMANFSSKWYSSPDPVLVAFLESQKRTESNELVAEASLGSHFGFPGC
jgi:hypothetical protein